MNDDTLRQLLRHADRAAPAAAVPSAAGLAGRVRDRRRQRAARRRRVFASAAVVLLAVGLAVPIILNRNVQRAGAEPAPSNAVRDDNGAALGASASLTSAPVEPGRPVKPGSTGAGVGGAGVHEVAAPGALRSDTDAQAALDARIVGTERRLAALERGERLARLAARRAAVRDVLADADERRASAVLDDAQALPPSPARAAARRRLFDLVVRLYPQTVSAAVARQEMQNNGPENRT